MQGITQPDMAGGYRLVETINGQQFLIIMINWPVGGQSWTVSLDDVSITPLIAV